MRVLMLAAMLATAAPAWGDVPAPDSSVSAWLNVIRQRLFDQARNSILFMDCITNGDVTEIRRFTQVFNEEVRKLSDDDGAFASEVFIAGQDQAVADFNTMGEAVCAKYGPAQVAEIRALATRRQDFWEAPK